MKSAFIFASLLILSLSQPSPRTNNPVFLNETYSSGTLPISNNGSMYYLLFDSRNDPSSDPLIIFFTGGGGGGSSLVGCFLENGPLRIHPDNLTTYINPYSWNNIANVMYVEQPLGVGFSTVENSDDYETTNEQITQDFMIFLGEFLQAFPEFKSRDLIISGEQVGGRWAALFGQAVYQSNYDINLKGITIGNGWMTAYWQYPAYGVYAYNNSLITEVEYIAIQKAFQVCQYLINQTNITLALETCTAPVYEIWGNPPKFNFYNIQEACTSPPFCYDFDYLTEFINQPDVLSALGQTGNWSFFSQNTYNADIMLYLIDISPSVAYLLNNNVPVITYNGDLDFDCNWIGGVAWAQEMDWNGKDDFNEQSYQERSDYGVYLNYGPLTFYKIYESGQLVPMDQPAASLDMLNAFIQNGNLN